MAVAVLVGGGIVAIIVIPSIVFSLYFIHCPCLACFLSAAGNSNQRNWKNVQASYLVSLLIIIVVILVAVVDQPPSYGSLLSLLFT